MTVSQSYYERITGYDKNGNILGLRRQTKSVYDAENLMDNLTYYYNGNQVIGIDDGVHINFGGDFFDNGHYYYNNSSLPEYTYDANGNMTSDLNKGIIGIRYNNQNLPTEIQMPLNCSILYSYDALGNKRAQYVYQPGGLVKTTYFVSNFVIENNVPMYSLYDEGRIVYDKGLTISSVEVNMKDHLGNVRAVFDITTGQVKQTNAYYPFGMQNSSLSANTTTTKNFNEYKYNGKMFQDENGLNWYDYGARFYDAVVGRWWSVDPHAENYYSWSPYHYAANNPLKFIDPTGMDWYEFDQNGNYQKKTEMDGTNRIMIHTVEKTKDGYVYVSYMFVEFADPEKDAQDIDDGTINKLVFVGEKEMQSMMKEQGAFESGKLNFGWESQGGGDFDYSYSVLREKYPDAKFNPKNMTSNSLFLPEGDNTAHNFMNFGNYLWGATGYTVGFDYAGLQAGAHANSLLNSRRNGYPAQWDSKDDQRSIIKGIYHAQTHKYRKLRK